MVVHSRSSSSEKMGMDTDCVVPEKIHNHPMEGHWKFLGGRRVLKATFLEAMYENVKLEFPGSRGGGSAKQKTFHGGSMDIFWNCTLCIKMNYPSCTCLSLIY